MNHLKEFDKIIDDRENIDDEDKNILLLSSSSRSSEYFNNVILYGNGCTIILDEIHMTVRSKEFSKMRD